jgi:hypothetical protein
MICHVDDNAGVGAFNGFDDSAAHWASQEFWRPVVGAIVDVGEPGVDAFIVVGVLAGVQVAEASEGFKADSAGVGYEGGGCGCIDVWFEG